MLIWVQLIASDIWLRAGTLLLCGCRVYIPGRRLRSMAVGSALTRPRQHGASCEHLESTQTQRKSWAGLIFMNRIYFSRFIGAVKVILLAYMEFFQNGKVTDSLLYASYGLALVESEKRCAIVATTTHLLGTTITFDLRIKLSSYILNKLYIIYRVFYFAII